MSKDQPENRDGDLVVAQQEKERGRLARAAAFSKRWLIAVFRLAVMLVVVLPLATVLTLRAMLSITVQAVIAQAWTTRMLPEWWVVARPFEVWMRHVRLAWAYGRGLPTSGGRDA